MIRIRIATGDDTSRLISFVGDHWSSRHIFVHRPDVFRWQHLQVDGRFNMVIAEDTNAEDGESVLGVLGFIPLGRFAPGLGDRDVMLAIWKVRDTGVPPGVGLRLLKFLQSELRPRLIAAIGTSQMVRPIYEVLGYEVGELRHAAVFHPDRRDHLRIADQIPESAFVAIEPDATRQVQILPVADHHEEMIDHVGSTQLPVKSWAYVEERYLRHPWYRYDVRVVVVNGEPVGAVIWRAVEANGTRLLRVVDVVGGVDWLGCSGSALQAEVIAADAEYLDIMQWGIDAEVLAEGGFLTRDRFPEMVLPNYFAPFERHNVEIELAYKVFDEDSIDVRLFRADSDQDRPNLVDEVDRVN